MTWKILKTYKTTSRTSKWISHSQRIQQSYAKINYILINYLQIIKKQNGILYTIAPKTNPKQALRNDFSKRHERPLHWKPTNVSEKLKEYPINGNIYHVHKSEGSILLRCQLFSNYVLKLASWF